MARKETTMPKLPDDVMASIEAAPVSVSADELSTVMQEFHSALPDDPAQAQNRGAGQVFTSPVFMPSTDALQSNMSSSAIHQATYGAEKSSRDTSLGDAGADRFFAGTIDQLKTAIGHAQIVQSAHTNVNKDGHGITMPAEVRDTPNSLYWYIDRNRQYHYISERAEKLMQGLFGPDLAEAVTRVAASRGFQRDPMVWVSQKLWENINYDYPHDYTKAQVPTFDAALDENPQSTIMQALQVCFSHFDVKALSRLARYNDKNILGILRTIMTDEMTKHKMSVPPPRSRKPTTDD